MKIKELRDQLSMTQEKFAEIVEVTQSAVSWWERNNIDIDSKRIHKLFRMAMKKLARNVSKA